MTGGFVRQKGMFGEFAPYDFEVICQISSRKKASCRKQFQVSKVSNRSKLFVCTNDCIKDTKRATLLMLI